MALTGSGTSADPYVVHSWSELLEAFNGADANYIELANDIEAPNTETSISATKTISLDGKGFAINNIVHSTSNRAAIDLQYTTSSQSITLKNIKFTNLYLTGGYAIHLRPTGSAASYYHNISFSGRVDSGTLIRVSYASTYGPWLSINSIAANIETGTGNCCILDNEWADSTGTIPNGNIKVKYLNCSPQNPLAGITSYKWSWSNTLFDITAEDTETKVPLGNYLTNCCVIGKGSGVTFTSGSGSVVVENTLSLPDPAPSNTYSLSTTDIKDAQTLHDDYGFPIGVD